MPLSPGLRAETVIMVESADTAVRAGNGELPVLAPLKLLAFAETIIINALRGTLEEGQATVGASIQFEHLAASPVGMHLSVAAELTKADGSRLVFTVSATDKHGILVGSGTIERTIVEREPFLLNLRRQGTARSNSADHAP